jgi:hypothetical protein
MVAFHTGQSAIHRRVRVSAHGHRTTILNLDEKAAADPAERARRLHPREVGSFTDPALDGFTEDNSGHERRCGCSSRAESQRFEEGTAIG